MAQQKAQERKDALNNNLEAWKIFENKKVETAKSQDGADKLLKSIKRVYDLEKGPADLAEKLKLAAAMRSKLPSSITLTIWRQVGDRGLLQPDQQRQRDPADLPAHGDEGRDARAGECHPLGLTLTPSVAGEGAEGPAARAGRDRQGPRRDLQVQPGEGEE